LAQEQRVMPLGQRGTCLSASALFQLKRAR
jgi:hypothetical protein